MERRRIALGAVVTALSLSAAPAGAQVTLPTLPPDVAVLLPAASDCKVTALDGDSVRVDGTVDPNSLATDYRIEYGLAGILNLSTPTLAIGSSPDPTAITAQLDDLVAGASYSCRIVALNAAGGTSSSTTIFRALSEGSNGSNGLNGSNGSGGTDATASVNPATGQVVVAGARGAVACTLVGTAGKDRLKGTKRRDVICGLGGADLITGLAGNDTLIGGPGNDRIRGSGGKDRLLGNAGRDRLAGNAGKDRLLGNGGKDRLLGGAGGDALVGGRAADYLLGSRGRDRMSGGAGNDRFVANRDRRVRDRLNGGRGRDRATRNRGDRIRSIERVRTMSR